MPHGRIDEAIAEFEGAYDRVLEQGRLLLELDPSCYMGHFAMGWITAKSEYLMNPSLPTGKRVSISAKRKRGRGARRARAAPFNSIAPEIYVPPTSLYATIRPVVLFGMVLAVREVLDVLGSHRSSPAEPRTAAPAS